VSLLSNPRVLADRLHNGPFLKPAKTTTFANSSDGRDGCVSGAGDASSAGVQT
jgi:hypothetical protein